VPRTLGIVLREAGFHICRELRDSLVECHENILAKPRFRGQAYAGMPQYHPKDDIAQTPISYLVNIIFGMI
jgi:hypothetical protein